jgi:hypothetical protein
MTLTKSLAAACFVISLLAAPAANAQGLPGGDLTGGVTDTIGGTTGGATDTVGGTTGGVTDTVDEVTDGATDTVDETTGGATGGATDTVDDTVDGVTDTVDETTGGATGTVNETTGGVTNAVENATGGGSNNNNNNGSGGGHNAHHVGSLSSGGSSLLDGLLGNTNVVPPSLTDIPANLIDDLVDRAAAKGMTPAAAEGWIEGEKVMDANAYATPLSAVLSLTTLFEDTALDLAQTTQVAGSTVGADDAPDASFFADAGQVAIEAAKTIAFPLALALLAVGFLMAQGRFGRKDPKLVLAPIDTRDESLTFE